MKAKLYILFFFTNLIFGQTDSISNHITNRINHLANNPIHSILLYMENENKNFIYNEGFGLTNKNGDRVTKHNAFKIASSTKLFVSTIILQLQEEGKLNIHDKIFPLLEDIEYLDLKNIHILNGIKHAQNITIEQLLSHRSGLADIFTDKEERFFEILLKNPSKQYSPKTIFKLYYQLKLNYSSHFKPSENWHYSDINYVLLGLIIEQLDKTKLSQSIRKRILDPLEMKNTFFEYYENPKKEFPQVNQYVGTINFSNINTSFDWAGGGLVSTNLDLSIFIKALFSCKLITQESLAKMTDVKFTKKHESRYGLGVYEFIINKDTYYGHFGFYNTFVGYCPKTKSTISYSISQTNPNFNTYKFISQLLRFIKN